MKAAFNTFNGGMSRDSDKSIQNKSTYRSSLNGRLVFKNDGTMAWSNIKGNKVSFSITAGYDVRGAIEIDSKLIILSYNTSTTYSEIGLVELDDGTVSMSKITPTYEVMFNDSKDPYGEKLNLTARCDMQSYAEVSEENYLTNTGANEENEFIIERIYWTDNINEPRSFNLGMYYYIKKFYPSFDMSWIGFAFLMWNTLSNGETTDKFYSVHNMALRPDMKMGFIEHKYLNKGNLLSGQYMYSYRLVTLDGKTSNWHPVTNKMSIVDSDIDSTNWNKYHMNTVGTNSGKSNVLNIYIHDNRWKYLEVAYVYYSTELVAQEAKIFFNGKISRFTTVSTIIEVEHTDNTGTSITAASLKQQYIPVERAKTLAIKNKTLLFGNYKERNPIELTTAKLNAINVKPFYKLMRSDDKEKMLNVPHTNQSIGTYSGTWKSMYLDRTDTDGGAIPGGRYAKNTLEIHNDYRNYKGVQVETSFSGYFRGETYRIGILFYDKKGKPGFVQHICDITMPEIHGDATSNATEYTIGKLNTATATLSLNIPNDTGGVLSGGGSNHPSKYTEGVNVNSWPLTYDGSLTHNTKWGIDTGNFPPDKPGYSAPAGYNNYGIRIMGLWIDGIDLTDIIDDISGYEIVRSPRDERNLGKGLLLPTSYLYDGTITKKTFPTPILYNRNSYSYASGGNNILDDDGILLGSIGGDSMRYREKTFQFLSPDLMMSDDYTIAGQDKIRLESCLNLSWRGPSDQEQEEVDGANDHFMVKLYESYGPSNNSFYVNYDLSATNYVVASYLSTDILKSFTKTSSGGINASYDPGNTNFIYYNYYPGDGTSAVSCNRGDSVNAISGFHRNNSQHSMAVGSNDNIVLVLDTFRRVVPNFGQDAGGATVGDHAICPPIVSLYRDGGGTYGGITENSLAASTYESIGEFSVINTDIKAKIENSATYIVDGRETWGGDCYLDIFDMTYLVPWYQYGADCATPSVVDTDHFFDFALGIMFPIESKYNFMLHRKEHGFAGVGTKSQFETEEGVNRSGAALFPDGHRTSASSCHSAVRENFDDSGLGHFDNSEYSHAVKPILYKQLVTFPYSWIWSTSKSHGETYDNFSRIPIANRLDLEGKHGKITSNGSIGDMLVSFQETAFGKLPVKDRAVLPSGDSSLIIGNASFMDRIDYASINVGNKDQFSLVSNGSHLFWTDTTNGKLYQFGGGGLLALNDSKGFHNYFEEILKSVYGSTGANIHSGYDAKNHEVYFSILVNPNNVSAEALTLIQETGIYDASYTTVGATLIYNTHLKAFTSFISAIPNIWFSFGDNFYSTRQQLAVPTSQEKVYIYNENTEGSFFDTLLDSKIKLIINDAAQYSKVFDNIVMNINSDGYGLLKTINIATDDQTQSLNVLTDTRAKYREQFYRLPLRGLNETQRIRGKWVDVEFVFKNESDKEIVFTDLETKYRISRKI